MTTASPAENQNTDPFSVYADESAGPGELNIDGLTNAALCRFSIRLRAETSTLVYECALVHALGRQHAQTAALDCRCLPELQERLYHASKMGIPDG